MRHVPPRISREESERFFRGPQWRNLFGLCAFPPVPAGKNDDGSPTLPWIECVWLPHYRIDIEGHYARRRGCLSASIEAWSGAFAFFQLHDTLAEGLPPGPYFEAGIPEEEAVRLARREMLRNIMRRRGQQEKPALGKTLSASLFHYPFQVLYFQRRRGRIDIRIQDAYTGERGGNRNRTGLLQALTESRKSRIT
jgi:hypothetical protein